MTPTEEILVGLAELLSSAGVGSWAGAAGEVGSDDAGPVIVIGQAPREPARLVRLQHYRTSGDYLTDRIVGVQVLIRSADGAPDYETERGIVDALHALRAVTLGTGADARAITQCLLQSGAAIADDEAGRSRTVLNFYVYVNIAGSGLE